MWNIVSGFRLCSARKAYCSESCGGPSISEDGAQMCKEKLEEVSLSSWRKRRIKDNISISSGT